MVNIFKICASTLCLLSIVSFSVPALSQISSTITRTYNSELLGLVEKNCREFNQQMFVSGLTPRDIDAHRKYLKASADYSNCINRQQQFLETLSTPSVPLLSEIDSFLTQKSSQQIFTHKWENLNRANLWKPADSEDPVTGKLLHESIRAGDEARAVFGRIPAMSCNSPNAKILRTQVNGNQVQLLDNPDLEGRKQFAHIDSTGKIVQWSDDIKQCDKPSIAGGVTECGTGSRIVYETIDNVTWLLLCRKSLGENTTLKVGEPRSDFDINSTAEDYDSQENKRYADYWSEENPFFTLIGLIGHNKETGETAFFDGQEKGWNTYRFDEIVHPPGGYGYMDRGFRAKEIEGNGDATFYSNIFEIKCHACHDNKNPWILAPHTTFEEVGFRSVLRKRRFSSGEFSEFSRWSGDRERPFRIIGSEYIRRIDPLSTPLKQKSRGFEYLSSARSFSVKGCQACHTLTTQMTGRYFAYDALGLVNPVVPPQYIYSVDDPTEWEKQWKFLSGARTEWGEKIGKIKQWMPIGFTSPGPSELLVQSPKELLATILGVNTVERPDWYHTELVKIRSKLDKCANVGPGGIEELAEECDYEKLYTECVVPEIDPGKLDLSFTSDKLEVRGEAESQALFWQFKNDLGGVKDRDDVRFEAQLTRFPLVGGLVPSLETSPEVNRYELTELEPPPIVVGVSERGKSEISTEFESFKATLTNIAPANQPIGADPLPSDQPRQYIVNLPPLACGYRYVATVKARRFCFDGHKDPLSGKQGVSYIDVKCL